MRIFKRISKRLKAYVLIFAIVFASIPPIVMADDTTDWNNHVNGPNSPLDTTHVESYKQNQQDTVTSEYSSEYNNYFSWQNILNKSAAVDTGTGQNPNDTFDITLKVQGDQIMPPPAPIVCVLVLDTSGSMGSNPSGGSTPKINTLKDAATKFASSFLDPSTGGDRNALAIATYGYTGAIKTNSTGGYFFGSNSLNISGGVSSVINGLTANGSTNTQGGLLAAYKILKDSTGLDQIITDPVARSKAKYFIVLMSDGGANQYYILGDTNIYNTWYNTVRQPQTATENINPPLASYYTYTNIQKALLSTRTGMYSGDLAGSIGGDGNGAPSYTGQRAAVDAKNFILGQLSPISGAFPSADMLPANVVPEIYTVGFDMNT
ncbi:MAG: VWA domain-containing protein, partial [Oscillospiraceae bacterium]|nr:VWA domain-containing protein [Oscillospiraceae bacterium]